MKFDKEKLREGVVSTLMHYDLWLRTNHEELDDTKRGIALMRFVSLELAIASYRNERHELYKLYEIFFELVEEIVLQKAPCIEKDNKELLDKAIEAVTERLINKLEIPFTGIEPDTPMGDLVDIVKIFVKNYKESEDD